MVVPLGVHAPIGIKYGVGRRCVAHGRVPHPGREVGGQRRQEGVVVPVHVDVLIGVTCPGHPHADGPVGLQDGLVAEVGQGRHPVAEVDEPVWPPRMALIALIRTTVLRSSSEIVWRDARVFARSNTNWNIPGACGAVEWKWPLMKPGMTR